MYEIWLGLNIVYETVRPVLGLLVVLALLWLGMLVAVLRTPTSDWKKALPSSLIAGVVATVAVFVLAPAFTASSLSELKYWVDWAFLGASSTAAGAAVAVALWPLLAWLARRP
jgi:hypothetical protein